MIERLRAEDLGPELSFSRPVGSPPAGPAAAAAAAREPGDLTPANTASCRLWAQVRCAGVRALARRAAAAAFAAVRRAARARPPAAADAAPRAPSPPPQQRLRPPAREPGEL